MNRPIKSILLLLAAELVALGLFVFLVWIVQPSWVASAITGGLVFVLPSTYFTIYALSSMGDHRERWFLTAFLRGQSGKWILTTVGFALAFKFVQPLHSPIMFFSFGAVMLVHLVMTARLSEVLNPQTVKK
jgi:ATP synthase protein I